MPALDDGVRLLRARRFADARRVLDDVVRDDRRNAAGWVQLGLACEALGDYDAARRALRNAAGLEPDSADAQHGLGLVAMRVGDLERAQAHFEKAISIAPVAGYYSNLATVLRQLGRSDASDDAIRKAVELAPQDPLLHSNLILFRNYAHGDDGARLRAVADAWGKRHAQSRRPRLGFRDRDRAADRRLNVAYVSPDFRLHAVAFFIEPLLRAHDPTRVRIFCYADVKAPDDTTARIRGLGVEWRDAHAMTDDALEHAMLADAIDIAVDLAGHTSGNRLPLFGRRVAPVQVNYLGYLGTTGVPSIDYRITDARCDPPGATEAFNSEELIRLPGGIYSYTGDPGVRANAEPPVTRNGFITFGSFNQVAKITDETLLLWGRVLASVPDSRLLVKAVTLDAEPQRDTLRARAARAGIPGGRLVLAGPEESVTQHLGRYNDVDIALDTYPYNSNATAFEALWMGVPLVARKGSTTISRFAAAVLGYLDLDDLAGSDGDEYVRIATMLAGDRTRLSELRSGLRDRLATSTLCDPARLAREIEDAYRTMWRRWCADAGRETTP